MTNNQCYSCDKEHKPFKYGNDVDWIGCGACSHKYDVDEKNIIENRDKIELRAYLDLSASYEYDEYAIIKLKNKWYLLQTSGCSCPDPNETWGVALGPLSEKQLKSEIREGNYVGYTLDKEQIEKLLAQLDENEENSGNSWDPDLVYNCRKCGIGNLCDVCHLHEAPRWSCDECPPCEDTDE